MTDAARRKAGGVAVSSDLSGSAANGGLSVVTLSELAYGVQKSSSPERNRTALDLFVAPFQVLAYSNDACFIYGEIRAYLERKGTPIGAVDLMIVAHAIALRATLVSNNLRGFRRVPGLTTDNWVR